MTPEAMDAAILITIVLYMLSTAGYLAYFFLQKRRLQQAGLALLLAGFLSHTAAIAIGYAHKGHIPVSNLPETLSFAGWAVAGAFLVLHYRYNLKILGVCAAPFVALVMVIVPLLPKAPAETPAVFKSFWLVAHVTAIFIGEAAFALAAGAGLLYLLQDNAIKAKRSRFFLQAAALPGSSGFHRLRLHRGGLQPADAGAHHGAGLRQKRLGPVLELGPQGGLVRDLLAVLCRAAPRALDRRVAGAALGHPGDRRFRRAPVHVSGSQFLHGRAPQGIYQMKGPRWPGGKTICVLSLFPSNP
jgi:ABC-type transport system involved in cytochrome c biogenesis permease subunit